MKLDHLPAEMRRTHRCGELRPAQAGSTIIAMGWVARRRDLGSLIFIDLRDRTGLLQVVFNKETQPQAHARAEELRSEYVLAVEGKLVLRAPQTVNPAIATGEVELVAERLYILNDARTPPFPIEDYLTVGDPALLPYLSANGADGAASTGATVEEAVRLRYRFVDLRRPQMQANLELRHHINQEIRRYMTEQGFLEIETPFMTRSTPEGARDYLVPSRIQQGSFYALPQSPQLFKQILMIAGFDRYFQIVRCFRDEDLRADRQPEFTQLDVEMSYASPQLVFDIIEPLMKGVSEIAEQHWQKEWPRRLQGTPAEQRTELIGKRKPIECKPPFPRISYEQAMSQYGTDKPDLRYEEKIVCVDSAVPANILEEVGIRTPVVALKFSANSRLEGALTSRTALDTFVRNVSELARGAVPELKTREQEIGREPLLIAWFRAGEGARLFKNPELARNIQTAVGAKDGEVVFIGAMRGTAEIGDSYLPHRCFDILRRRLAERAEGYDPQAKRFLWVTEFPMFEYDPEEKRYAAMHHPFTSPTDETLDKVESDPGHVKAKAYDLVLNGTEIGGGSIRIHRKDVQARVFQALGMTPEQARQRFGFFLDALEYGTPPHGGIALGLDRIAAIFAMESSIREVIAFPKTARAVDLMCEAPTPVSPAQLRELGLALRKE